MKKARPNSRSVLCALVLMAPLASVTAHIGIERMPGPANPKSTTQHPNPGRSGINRYERVDGPTVYTGNPGLIQVLERGLAQPLTLASGDFNEDGVPDLVSGYVGPSGGIITLHRGNVEALWPQQRRREGGKERGGDEETSPSSRSVSPSLHRSVSPFLEEARVFELPEAPDFLGAGDFDADGHLDVVAAAKGSEALHWLRGDGRGEFGAVNEIKLSGTVTAMTTGEINRRDGLTDVVVGVTGPEGPQVLVFQSPNGALREIRPQTSDLRPQTSDGVIPQPAIHHPHPSETFALPAAATTLKLGQFDEGYEMDLAVEVEHEWFLIPGRDHSISDFGFRISDWPIRIPHSAFRIPPSAPAVLPLRLNGDALDDWVILEKGPSGPTVVLSAPMAAFTVNSTADPGDGTCNAAQCTLREAINAANAAGMTSSISFNIPGGGVPTITPASPLPAITVPVTLDGTTQAAGLVELNGSSAGMGADGLTLQGGSSTVRGMVINRFNSIGINVLSDGNLIAGNRIGTNVTGTAALGNTGFGVNIEGGTLNVVGGTTAPDRNLISGNTADGVRIIGENAQLNQVQGNYIGTNAAGTADLGNGFDGVLIDQAPNNTVGGTAAGAGNLISGNNVSGVAIVNGLAEGNLVQGNYIGTDVTGTTAVGNLDGVYVGRAPGNTVGGTAPTARNLISGNTGDGVELFGSAATENLVQGNLIGLDVAGTMDLGNTNHGVRIDGAPSNFIGGVLGARNIISGNNQNGILLIGSVARQNGVEANFIGTDESGTMAVGNGLNGVFLNNAVDNRIGDFDPGAGNLISGNTANGVRIGGPGATDNTVEGNLIGTQADGDGALGNGGHGVIIDVSAGSNTVGGTTNGAANTIAHNGGDGVFVPTGTGNAIRRNSIFSNTGLGIDLGSDGVTLNDPGDGDTGANHLQNFPVLTSATYSMSSVTISGTLDSTAGATFTLEFFANGSGTDDTHGEGETFIGDGLVMTDSSGTATFTITLPVGVATATPITATATDANDNTSEFSAYIDEGVALEPPVAQCKNVTVTAGAGCTASASVNDGSFDPDGGLVTLSQSPPGPYPLGMTMVTLTVTDNEGDMSQCTATVTIINSTPTANAGPDQTSDENTLVTLNGAASGDPDPSQSLSFQWTQVGGPSVTLSGATTATATFTAPDVPEGTCSVILTFQLKVTDPCGAMATDTVVVTVGDLLILQDDRNGNCLALDCCAGTYAFKVGRSWFTYQAIITKSSTKITFQSAPSDPNYLTGSVDLVMRRASVRLQAPRGGSTIHNIYDGNIDNNGPCQ